MGLFQSNNPKEKKNSGILGAFAVDVIKWEPEDSESAGIICHKYEYEDFPNGSYLIVGQSQMAVFTNNMGFAKSGESQERGQAQVLTFVGPCKIKLETGDSRFAPFRNVSHKLTGGESAFHSTVYFINTTYMTDLNWGTQSPIVVLDPEEEVNVHVRAFGYFGAHIEKGENEESMLSARKFLEKVVGTKSDYTRQDLVGFMRAKILEYVPDMLAKNMVEMHVGILKISTKISEFSAAIRAKLVEHFKDFGLTLDNFSFHSINAPDEDLRALNESKINRKKALLEAEASAAKMDIESAARARMREREGYTYQEEQGYDVMKSAASNEGSAGNLMGAGMGVAMGLGVGNAVGAEMRNIAGQTLGNTHDANTPPAERGKQCAECGKENPSASKFCLECGAKFVQGAVCGECGKEIPSGAKFCMYCGTPIRTGCPSCGAELPSGAKFCLECGTKM
ncbi:MAG: SPFH domain-containing protein [Bacillota bacterium]|nr:SPFH domain-containing protein [Bacillota bacterium]